MKVLKKVANLSFTLFALLAELFADGFPGPLAPGLQRMSCSNYA
jgi:hypothetical protein